MEATEKEKCFYCDKEGRYLTFIDEQKEPTSVCIKHLNVALSS
jgi:hypothetical protein